MTHAYENGSLACDGVPLSSIAEGAGTPCYIYSAADIIRRFCAYEQAFGDLPHQVCYAVKANSNLSILNLLAREGAAFDIVSGGELYRVLRAGGDPRKVVFSGVGKTREELEYALRENVRTFNCESESEIELLDEVARGLETKARMAVRVN